MENCKGKDMLEQLLRELKKDFPELSRVIMSERDLYLANSIRNCADGSKIKIPTFKICFYHRKICLFC